MISSIPVIITPSALTKIKSIMAEKAIPKDYGLRLGTNDAASCGTTSFIIGFDTKKTGDDSFIFEEIEVLIKKKDMLYMINITLDYLDTKDQKGFQFGKSND